MAEDAPPVDQRRHRPDPPDERGRSLRRAATITAGMGVLHAVLFLLAFFLLAGAPGPEATDEEIIAYYSSSAGRLPSLVGLYIMPFAAIAFMWFIVALRMWEASRSSARTCSSRTCSWSAGSCTWAMLAVGIRGARGARGEHGLQQRTDRPRAGSTVPAVWQHGLHRVRRPRGRRSSYSPPPTSAAARGCCRGGSASSDSRSERSCC